MKINIHHQCREADSYRAARVKSMFNVDSGADVHIRAELPLDAKPWQIGLVVGASGSGKTSIINRVWDDVTPYQSVFPHDKPIIDAIAPTSDFDSVTSALSAVGLGTVPAWLRPYTALSNGDNPYNRPMTMLFHTSHPHLAGALRHRPQWTQVSARLYNKASRKLKAAGKYGGHFRGVQGFRYLGGDHA